MPEKALNEPLNTPQEQIGEMGRRILSAIDEIIEEYGWHWSKQPPGSIPIPTGATTAEYGRINLLNSPLSLGRRFDPKNHGTNYQPEAHWMESVLEHGIIPVLQVPNKLPEPRGIMINLRGAPEFNDWWSEDSGGRVYKEKSTQVVEDLLRKLGFMDRDERITDPGPGKTHHGYREGHYVSDDLEGGDYSWIKGSSQWTRPFIEMRHPELPFVVDVVYTQDAEPPLVFVRYIPNEQFAEGDEAQVVEGVQAMFRGSQGSGAVQAAEEILNQARGEVTLTDIELRQVTGEIINKQGRLVKLLSQYPKRDITDRFLPENQRKVRFSADLGQGSEVYEDDDLVRMVLKDQQPPLRFDIEFFHFRNPEVGAAHPYTRGEQTDNLITIHTRDNVDELWEAGTYFIDPRGKLQKLKPPSKEPNSEPEIVQPDTSSELNRVSQVFDVLRERLQQN